MPKNEFGEFSFLTSSISYLSLIVGLYLFVPFIRSFCADENELQQQKLVSTILISLVIWIFFIDIFLVVLKPFLSIIFAQFFKITISPVKKYYLVIMSINAGVASLYCYSLIMSRKSTTEIVLYTSIKFSLLTLFNLILLYTNPLHQDTVVNRLLSTAVIELIINLLYLLTVFRVYLRIFFDLRILQSHLIVAIPLLPSAIIGLLTTLIDRSLIAEHHGLGVLANYNLAMQALVPIQMVMSAVQVAWAPHLFSIKNIKTAFKQSIDLVFVSFGVMLVGPGLIFLAIYMVIEVGFISIDYKKVPLIILFGSFGAISGSLSHITNNMFVQLSRTGFLFWIGIFSLLVNWLTNLYLIPEYSSYGACFANGISNILSLLIGLFIISKIIKNDYKNVE